MNQLEQLAQHTVVVADTGDIKAIAQFKPTDATTNPSLLYKASGMAEYQHLVEDAVNYAKSKTENTKERISLAMDKLAVNFGVEILKLVSGVVSTEVDARLSFDTEATVQKARDLIALYKEAGVEKERVLIKIASTWEGIQAAAQLEKEGIHCNLTLLFSFCQAVACADAKVTLISPFVGRIMDWYKNKQNVSSFKPSEDPGVLSVQRIYNFYKKHGIKTVVMGASFRNKGEVLELCGCDKLTIGPNFLAEMQQSADHVPRVLSPEAAAQMDIPEVHYDEKSFRYALNEDAMATEKLAEGIRLFAADIIQLEKQVAAKLA